MPDIQSVVGPLTIGADETGAIAVAISAPAWPGFRLEGLRPRLQVNGVQEAFTYSACTSGDGFAELTYRFPCGAELHYRIDAIETGVRVAASMHNDSGDPLTLNHATLLETGSAQLGEDPGAVRALEQAAYWGRIVSFGELLPPTPPEGAAEPAGNATTGSRASEEVSLVFDRSARQAFLAGFTSGERWLGRVEMDAVDGALQWRMCFDGGDTRIDPDESLALESFTLRFGDDPWAMLCRYAEDVARQHNVSLPEAPPVTWCSWYPYRLGVTEDRVVEEARVAAQRLKPLGLSTMVVDLGWQAQQLPSTFEENEQFARGLKWLADELARLDLDLGVWTAPYTISEFDPVVKEHPEFLICDESGAPAAYWTWFWAPHGNVYILDLSHPGAQDWLRGKMESLAARGVRYLKADFVGCASHGLAKRRHNPRIVSGGGLEGPRIGSEITRRALPDALLLNCGAPEMPGRGHWPLIYTCSDTGNTGFLSPQFQEENYRSVACHLWKNRRWGHLQPSCLCVGLPGTLEEARLRATIAFMTGGQVDIGDTLTTLPEDRWRVLLSTVPSAAVPAKPLDLFEPLYVEAGVEYSKSCQELGEEAKPPKETPSGSVWHVPVATDWDSWDLLAFFCYERGAADAAPDIARFRLPLERFGHASGETFSAFEFWSGQYLGDMPGQRSNPRDYTHPGDYQDLKTGAGDIAIAFFGPAVKLLCLRRPRNHPWVAGTTFHQSCGGELASVAWDPAASTLRGILRRPAGEEGHIIIAPAGREASSATYGDRPAPWRTGANGAITLPVIAGGHETHWEIRFA